MNSVTTDCFRCASEEAVPLMKGNARDSHADEFVMDPEKWNSSGFEDNLYSDLDNTYKRSSSIFQATINSSSLLLGIGMLSVPYSLAKGGWLSLTVLIAFGVACCYTAYILGCCLQVGSNLVSYQDIGYKAFGLRGRIIVTTILYIEIFAVLVGYTISLGDNLAEIFPGLSLNNSWIHFTGSQILATIAIVIILPTVWLRNLSSLSYLSLGGVATYLIIVICVAWAGVYSGVGFPHGISALRSSNIPAVAGLYAYCYSGHVIFPTIYSSMKDPSKFPKVLVVSFTVVTTIYIGFAFLGATMFGDAIQSQITLSMPKALLVTKIALWVVVITPLSKYSLSVSPIALELEQLLPSTLASRMRYAVGLLIRTAILLTVLVVALALPFFGYMLGLIGSSLGLTMSIVIPCICYMKLFGSSMKLSVKLLNIILICMGVVFGVIGTISSMRSLIESLKGSP